MPVIYSRLLLIFSILFIVLINNLVYGAEAVPKGYYLKPATIISEIKSRGAKSVVVELYRDSNVWDYICNKIATGDQAWLKAAVALQVGTDGGPSEMLYLAVGEALEHAPENVFMIAASTFELQYICGGPDVDKVRYNSYELSIKAISLRIKKVAAIKGRSLVNVSKECIQYLEASKKSVAQFYEVEKK